MPKKKRGLITDKEAVWMFLVSEDGPHKIGVGLRRNRQGREGIQILRR